MNKFIKISKSKIVILFSILSILGLFVYAERSSTVTYTREAAIIKENEPEINEYSIKSGDTFSNIMTSFGISGEYATKILTTSQNVFDFTKIKAGQILKVALVNKAFASIEYVSSDHEKIVVEKSADGFTANKVEIQYDIEQAVAAGTINSSLFEDASAVGLSDKTIMKLADIFGWDIDFASDIREGDTFKVVYEKRSFDGKPVGAGRILAAKFDNQGKTYSAFYYKDSDGHEQYYDTNGQALSRQFLKSPLDYKYISTKFTNRRVNPVTKKIDTHYAIDYASPSGTPIVASSDGVITYAGWKGGYGTDVEIKHGNSYDTLYAHLSKIAKGIKKGVSVKQGQIIGYVGSTGISTGPHLHFAMYKNGSPINPLTADLPAGEPIKESSKADFDQVRDNLKNLLD